jgi:hypothetical protein
LVAAASIESVFAGAASAAAGAGAASAGAGAGVASAAGAAAGAGSELLSALSSAQLLNKVMPPIAAKKRLVLKRFLILLVIEKDFIP